MTNEQLQQIDQARRYAEQDDYVVTRTHIRNLLAIIEQQAASVPDGWMRNLDEVNALHKHLFERGWAQDWQCQDQACAMAAEIIEKILFPALKPNQSAEPSCDACNYEGGCGGQCKG